MPSNNYHQLQIINIVTETKVAKTFVLQPLHGWQPQYKPGQFITLVFTTKHGEKRRSYSISSSPVLNEALCITIKKVDNGEFSRLMLSHAKVGDVILSSGITGFFLLPDIGNEIEQFFFFAAGSGITPCYPLIKTLLQETDNKIVLVYSNRSEEETIFYKQLGILQNGFSKRLQIHFLFSNKINVYESRLSNWLLQQLLNKYLAVSKEKVLFYLCGPFEYMQMITITLLNEGIEQKNIHKENFNTLPRIIKPVPPDTAPHNVLIHFQNEVHNITVQYPQTVLAAAKANNIALPYSCEAGRCGSCAATCVNGKFWMAYNEVLMDDELAKGRILCCQAYPVEGNAEIFV
ncbi:MAG: iron-sulfur cluster-binding domain-containing protein [Bacteroidota bacterium]